MGIPRIIVYGNSLMVINRVKRRCRLNVINLEHWCKRIDDMVRGFTTFNCQHIYHEHNKLADRLSKGALVLTVGALVVQEFMEGVMIHEDMENIFSWKQFSYFFLFLWVTICLLFKLIEHQCGFRL